jgi:hypothetical protein
MGTGAPRLSPLRQACPRCTARRTSPRRENHPGARRTARDRTPLGPPPAHTTPDDHASRCASAHKAELQRDFGHVRGISDASAHQSMPSDASERIAGARTHRWLASQSGGLGQGAKNGVRQRRRDCSASLSTAAARVGTGGTQERRRWHPTLGRRRPPTQNTGPDIHVRPFYAVG